MSSLTLKIFGPLVILTAFSGVLGLALCWWYRDHRLIRARGFWTIFTSQIFVLCSGLTWNLGIIFDLRCVDILQASIFLSAISGLFFAESLFVINMKYGISREALEFYKSNVEDRESEQKRDEPLPFNQATIKWMLKNRRAFSRGLFSLSKLVCFALSIMIFAPVSHFIRVLTSEETQAARWSSADQCVPAILIFARMVSIMSLPATLIIIDCTRRLRTVQESFYIKSEVKLARIPAFLVLSMHTFIMFCPEWLIRRMEYPVSSYGLIVRFGAVSMVMLTRWLTLWRIWKEGSNGVQLEHSKAVETTDFAEFWFVGEGDKTRPQLVGEESFKTLLAEHNLRSEFRQFLVTEFAVENLLFWEAVEDLKNQSNQLDFIHRIYNTFCAVNSPLMIKLTGEQMEKLTHVLFERTDIPDSIRIDECLQVLLMVQQCVFQLMLNDSFRRFTLQRIEFEQRRLRGVFS
jgi:hypothetical protein